MSPLLSRLTALLLVVGVGMAAIFGVALPVSAWLDGLAEERDALRAQIARFEARITSAEARVEIELAEPAVLEAADPVLAAAEMQRSLTEAVAAGKGALTRVAVEAPRPVADGLLAQPVSAELTVGVPGLRRLLHRLETARPYLVVEHLEVRRQSARRDVPEPELSVTLRISGFLEDAGGR